MTQLQITDVDKERIDQVWNVVFRASGKIIRDARVHGFDALGDLPRPNIHDMVLHLKVFGAIIDVLYATDGLTYEQQRQLLNSKKQIATLEELAAAVLNNARNDFETALEQLEKQCVI